MSRRRSDVSRALPPTKPVSSSSANLPAGVDPLHESSAEVWQRWSRDRERREVSERMHEEAKNRELANRPIWPRECARRCAEESRHFARDWRAIRPELGPAWGKLLK